MLVTLEDELNPGSFRLKGETLFRFLPYLTYQLKF
jgi:hypothetical protein